MAVAADDINIASADEHIHHYHRVSSWHLKVASLVVAFAASTASAAAVAAGLFATVAWTAGSVAVSVCAAAVVT